MNLPGAKHGAKCQTPALGSFGRFCLSMVGVLLFGVAMLAAYVMAGDAALAGFALLVIPFIAHQIRKGGDK